MRHRNYHTHTFRCKHATGDVSDYAQAAVEAGLITLGMSDHTPLPNDRWLNVRMAYLELPEYEAAIATARARFPQLQIFKGLECEYALEFQSFLQEELLERRAFDYLIGAGHYTPFRGEWINSFEELNSAAKLRAYARHLETMMYAGLFAFIAHPDLFGCCNDDWNDDLSACAHDILQVAEATQVPLEINGYGFRKRPRHTSVGRRPPYPWRPFWEIAAEYKIRVICNSDAHHPADVAANLEDAHQLAQEFGLSVVEELAIAQKPSITEAQAVPLSDVASPTTKEDWVSI
jgi:histidinol-phosphatase (PHP family)